MIHGADFACARSNQDIANQAVLEVSDRLLYDIENNRAPYRHGPLDPRLVRVKPHGPVCAVLIRRHRARQARLANAQHVKTRCKTARAISAMCGFRCRPFTLVTCDSSCLFCRRFARYVVAVRPSGDGCLQAQDCGRVLLEEPERRSFLKELRRPFLDNLRRTQICKRINEQCRKCKTCPYCGSINGQIRKTGVLKLAHDKFVAFNKSTSVKKVPPEAKVKFENSFAEARRENPELEKHLRKAMEDLNPLRVLKLFKRISLPTVNCWGWTLPRAGRKCSSGSLCPRPQSASGRRWRRTMLVPKMTLPPSWRISYGSAA